MSYNENQLYRRERIRGEEDTQEENSAVSYDVSEDSDDEYGGDCRGGRRRRRNRRRNQDTNKTERGFGRGHRRKWRFRHENTHYDGDKNMIICLGTDGDTLDSTIAKRFGHAAFYLLYNIEDNLPNAVRNEVLEHETHEDEDHAHGILSQFLQQGIKNYIVGNIGPFAFERLQSGGARIYLARNMQAAEAIEHFRKEELQELNQPTAAKSICHHAHKH
jgi:predicted Fe-Mo cluster-binding NifX family protein